MKKIFIPLLFVLVFSLNFAYSSPLDDFLAAEDIPQELEINYLGVGAVVTTQAYTGVDEDVIPVPIIDAQYKRFFIEYDTVGFILGENDQLRAALIAKPRNMGYENDDSIVLNGMQDRDWSIDAGLGFVADQDYFTAEANFVIDVLGEHEGYEGELVLSTEFFEGFLVPRCGAKWQSKDLVDYYYGVESSEVRAGRPAYQGDDAINYIAGTQVRIPFLEKWVAILDVQYEHLDDVIQDSPIVNEDSTMTYSGGIVYQF